MTQGSLEHFQNYLRVDGLLSGSLKPRLVTIIRSCASALLLNVILIVVYTKGLRGFSGIVIGGFICLDIFFLAFVSGASMNPAVH
jgi:glycerol uptake facilitator-like aquaporin